MSNFIGEPEYLVGDPHEHIRRLQDENRRLYAELTEAKQRISSLEIKIETIVGFSSEHAARNKRRKEIQSADGGAV